MKPKLSTILLFTATMMYFSATLMFLLMGDAQLDRGDKLIGIIAFSTGFIMIGIILIVVSNVLSSSKGGNTW